MALSGSLDGATGHHYEGKAMMISPLVAGLAGLGLLLVFIGGRASIRQAAFNRRAVSTTGRVVHYEQRRTRSTGGTSRIVHYPMVEYRTQDGQVLRRLGLGQRTPGPPGTAVPVLYDPQNPTDVSFLGKRGQLGLPKILIACGVLLIAASAALGLGLMPRLPLPR